MAGRTVSAYAAKYLAVRLEAHMTAQVTITRAAGTPTLDRATGLTTASTGTVYTGKAHVAYVAPAGNPVVGDAPLPEQTVTVSLPYDAAYAPQVNDRVEITACAPDASLVGRTARVTGYDGGGLLRPVRRLTCELYGANQWRTA